MRELTNPKDLILVSEISIEMVVNGKRHRATIFRPEKIADILRHDTQSIGEYFEALSKFWLARQEAKDKKAQGF